MNQEIRGDYYHKQDHDILTNMTFWHINPEGNDQNQRMFDESWIKPYVSGYGNLIKQLQNTKSSQELPLLHKQVAACSREISKLLNHIRNVKNPLSYKLISHNEIEIDKSQKFIITLNNVFGHNLKDIVLITGDPLKQHIDHLTTFVEEYIINKDPINHSPQWILHNNIANNFTKIIRTDWLHNTLWWGSFKEDLNNWIHVDSNSIWYQMTSNVTAWEIFRNLFPNHKITTDTR